MELFIYINWIKMAELSERRITMQNHITIKNPACYDLDPYIGRYCEYTSIDEPDKPFTYAGHIERDSRGEAMVHDSGESWVYAYTGVISEIKIYM